MTKLTLLVSVAAIALATQTDFARADEVPNYDIRKSCKADVQAYQGGGSQQGCLTDEQNARTTLASQWTQFGAESRTRCMRLVSDISGNQSYVELLTCLQMARDVKSLPKD